MRTLIVAGLAAGIALMQPASAQTPALADLPAALKPAGLSVYLEVPATGVQIYTCGKNDAGAFTWVFKAPEAALYDTQKKQIGKHYAGPTWEALAGGKVVGAVKASSPAQNSIPWLLLDIKSSEGSGIFNKPRASCGCRRSAAPRHRSAATRRMPARKRMCPTPRRICF